MMQTYARFIRWAFERFYREFAWTYDTVAALVSAGHWREWALVVLPKVRGQVLELGCGTGHLQRALARHPALVVGLDRSPQMLNHTYKRLKREHFTAHLLRADAQYLPLLATNFDTIVATFPTDYITTPETLRNIKRVLRPHGQLLVVLGARLTHSTLYQRFVDLAYRLTLQRHTATPQPQSPFDPMAERLIAAFAAEGLYAEARWVRAPGGEVFLISAEPIHATNYD
jgi:ubiquinone/menaquinone biosynthesis C-methylase UbiE